MSKRSPRAAAILLVFTGTTVSLPALAQSMGGGGGSASAGGGGSAGGSAPSAPVGPGPGGVGSPGAGAASAGGAGGGAVSAGGAGTAGGEAAASAGGQVAPGGAAQAPGVTYVPYGLPPPGYDPNAYLPSSSQPTLDINQPSSHFDLNQGTPGPNVVYGNKEGSGILPEDQPEPVGVANVPEVYEVRRGDTLWSICERFFHNPWEWPRVWALNPELQNPHWIYPGEQLRLIPAPPAAVAQGGRPGPGAAPGAAGTRAPGRFVGRRPAVPPGTVFLRDQGYLDDVRDEWGELGGSPEDQMLLSTGDIAYFDIAPGHDVTIGQDLTVFRPLGPPKHGDAKGTLVAILGTARVNGWNPRTRIARAELIESVDVIERGAKVGPVDRRFDVVPPVKNAVDLRGHIAASLYPHAFYGQNQVVFIDRGARDGLVPGNRLFVIDQGDRYRRTLVGASEFAAADVRYETDKPATIVKGGTLGREEDEKYPEEVVGELRVLRTRDHSAACLVTSARYELEPGQNVVAKVGY